MLTFLRVIMVANMLFQMFTIMTKGYTMSTTICAILGAVYLALAFDGENGTLNS